MDEWRASAGVAPSDSKLKANLKKLKGKLMNTDELIGLYNDV